MKTKTIELAVIENDLCAAVQLAKVTEEYNEFLAEFINVDFSRDAAVAEGLDLIQATFTLINKFGLSDEDIEKHLQKLEGYEKTGRI